MKKYGFVFDEISREVRRFKTEFSIINLSDKKLNTKKTKNKNFIIEFDKSMIVFKKYFNRLSNLISKKINLMIKNLGFKKPLNILCVGIGNNQIICDSLGPKVVRKIYVTRDFQVVKSKIIDVPTVSAVNPDIFAKTGIETIDFIKVLSNTVKADLVIVVDSLATKKIERIGSTVQIIMNGIAPGKGINTNAKMINKNTIGVDCIGVGIPLISVYKSNKTEYITMPSDIDELVNNCADIIAYAINLSIFGKDYIDVIRF